MRIAASACLAGRRCRYDGKAKPSREILERIARGEEVLLFCPECLGGLATPREPSEIAGTGKAVLEGKARVLGKDGSDRTAQFLAGAQAALAQLKEAGIKRVYLKSKSPSCGVGKIYDIFDGEGVSEKLKTTGNANGMEVTLELAQRGFSGLAFVNLVDFDMVYGHRNDVDGYANAATEFDGQLAKLLPLLRAEDLLIITADHGCDPATPSTDHSREYVPMLAYGKGVRAGVDLGTRRSFACIAQTVCEYLGVPVQLDGKSFLKEILR